MTGLASYMVPKVEVLIAATLRSDQGAPLRAQYNAPVGTSAATPGSVWQALGRQPAVAGSTMSLDLVKPGEVWGDRVNELNLRFAKVLRFAARAPRRDRRVQRPELGCDPDLQPDVPVNGPWLAPQSVLTPRFVKVSAQIDF